MNEIIIESPRSISDVASFENFDEIKSELQKYIKNNFEVVNYTPDEIEVAKKDEKQLKKLKADIANKKKELQAIYTAPYETVEKMLDELTAIIDGPYKYVKNFIDTTEKDEKRHQILEYAYAQVESLGDSGLSIVDSPAFFKNDWLQKKYTVKKYQDEINEVIKQATRDLNSIQTTGGENKNVLMARYYETLSMDSVKSFLDLLQDCQNTKSEFTNSSSDNNVVGYKVLKISATEDQMSNILNQLALMGVKVEEIEDGMPKPMSELLNPDFDSFVAFDIETTGTYGAAKGDEEAKITEIGAVKVVNGKIVDKFDELANPGRKIVPQISRMTHITDAMLADKPPVDEVIKHFYEFVGDSILLGHNIKSSDLHYIIKAANKAGIHFEGSFFDTYVYAKQFKEKKNWDSLSLSYLAKIWGLEHKEVHRAWSDAEVNAKLYLELRKL